MANSGSGQNVGSVLAGALGAGVSAIPGGLAQERQQNLQNIMQTMQMQSQMAAQEQAREQLELNRQRLAIAQAAERRTTESYMSPVDQRTYDIETARQIGELETGQKLGLEGDLGELRREQILLDLQNLTGLTTKNLGPIVGPDAFREVPLTIGELAGVAAEKYPTVDIGYGGIGLPGVDPTALGPTAAGARSQYKFEETNRQKDVLAKANVAFQKYPLGLREKIGLAGITSVKDLQKVLAGKEFTGKRYDFGVDWLDTDDTDQMAIYEQLRGFMDEIVSPGGVIPEVADPGGSADPLDAELRSLEKELGALGG